MKIKGWVIKRRLFDAYGEHTGSIIVKRFNQQERPEVTLNKDETLFQVVESGVYDRRLAYPAAHGLTQREGV